METRADPRATAAVSRAYCPCPAGPRLRAISTPVPIDATDWTSWLANVWRNAARTRTVQTRCLGDARGASCRDESYAENRVPIRNQGCSEHVELSDLGEDGRCRGQAHQCGRDC